MAAPRVRVDHDQLSQIARRFSNQADRVRSTQQSLNENVQALKSGDWIGKGATAFYQEMDQTIFPAFKRLGEALSQAQRVTQQISRLLQDAEQSMSAIFVLIASGSASGGAGAGAGGAGGFAGASASASGSTSKGGGFLSQVGGFFEGVWEGAKGMVGGLWHAVTNPIDTLKGVAYAVTHPGELWDALKKPYVEDWQSGNYGRAIGRGVFEVAMLLIPGVGEAKAVGKGAEVASVASKVAKAADVAETAGTVARGARAAEGAAAAGRAAELAEVAATLARHQRLASEALGAADKAADAARAADVFTSAQKALSTSEAAGAISTFKAADAANIPKLMESFGGDLGRVGDIPAELAGRRVTTIGRNAQTLPAGEAGARILKVPGETWSNELNALWMREAVNNGDVFKLATGVAENTGSLAGAAEYGGISVYARELSLLQEAGYTRVGDFLIPPIK